MNRFLRRNGLVFVAFCLVFIVLGSGCASSRRYLIVDPLTTPLNNYTILEVGEVKSNLQENDAVKLAGELSDMIVQSLAEYKNKHSDAKFFSQVTKSSEQTDQVLVMESALLSYEKGSQAARYFIGFGAGKAYCTIQSRFIDKKTSQQVLKANFEGELSGGFFGGDSKTSAEGVVNAIIDYLKKNY